MRKFVMALAFLTALAWTAAPAFSGEGAVLSDQELAGVTAGVVEGDTSGDLLEGPGNNNIAGVQLNGYAQSNASAMVIQNLNQSQSIVQINLAVSFGGDVTGNTATNNVSHSQGFGF